MMESQGKPALGVVQPNTILPVVWFCAVAVLGLFAVKYGAYLMLAGVLGIVLLVLILAKPEVATLAIIFVLYANLADVAQEFHGVPKSIAASIMLLLGVPLIVYVVVRRERLIVDRVLVLMLAFFVVLSASALMAQDAMAAISWMSAYLLQGVVLYFLVTNVVRESATLQRAIWVLLLAGSLMGGISLTQELTGTQSSSYGGFAQAGGLFAVDEDSGKIVRQRATGPIGEQNRYAQILLVLLPLALFRFWGERKAWLRISAAAAGGLILSGVLLSFSRGAFVAMVLLVAVMTYMRYLKLRQTVQLAIVGALLMVLVVPAFISRIKSLTGIEYLLARTGPKADRPMINRAAQNMIAVHVFLDYPILGVGPGQFVFYTRRYADRLGLAGQRPPLPAAVRQDKGYRAHNLYLEIAAETGLIGFVLFMSIISAALYPLWKAARHLPEGSEGRNFAAGLFFSLVAYLTTGLFLHLAYQRYFWLLLALATAAARIAESEVRDSAVQEAPAVSPPWGRPVELQESV